MKRLVLVVVAALVLAPAAAAKMCVRIATVPANPIAGTPVTIRVTAMLVTMEGTRPVPGRRTIPLPPQARINVRVTPPGAPPQMLRVRRRADRPSVLEGRFTFPSAGAWTLGWAAFPNYSACAGTIQVRVGLP